MIVEPEIKPVNDHFLLREPLQRFGEVVLAAAYVQEIDGLSLIA